MQKLGRRTVTTVRLIETAHDGFQLAEGGMEVAGALAETLLSASILGLRHREVDVPQEVYQALDQLTQLIRDHRNRGLNDDEAA